METDLEALSYPIGRFIMPDHYSETELGQWIRKIEAAPKWYDYSIENLDADQLNTPYRPGGWTINQVIHHVADSHMNAYTRCKLAITEDTPHIKPYDEKLWAELPDVSDVPVNVSITLLHCLHLRWVSLLKKCDTPTLNRTLFHPGEHKNIQLWQMIAQYAWHGSHHFEQICRLRERRHW